MYIAGLNGIIRLVSIHYCQTKHVRKHDGEYYFEAVEALSRDYFAKEHEAQFLALCPLYAAMYNEFVKHDEGAMESLKNALMNSEALESPCSSESWTQASGSLRTTFWT